MHRKYDLRLLILVLGLAAYLNDVRCADVEFEVAWTIELPEVTSVNSVVVRDSLLFCASGVTSEATDKVDFRVGKIVESARVEWLGSLTSEGEVNSIVLSGSTAILANTGRYEGGEWMPGEGLISVDVTDPAQPRRLDVLPMTEEWRAFRGSRVLAIIGERVYVSHGTDGLAVVDVSNPSQLRLVEDYSLGLHVTAVDGAEGVSLLGRTGDGNLWMGTLDGSEPEVLGDLQLIAEMHPGRGPCVWLDVSAFITQDTVLACAWENEDLGLAGFHLLNITSPTAVSQVGQLVLDGRPVGMGDGLVYTTRRVYDGTEAHLALTAYRIGGLSNPQRVGQLRNNVEEDAKPWNRIAVRDDVAFVAGRTWCCGNTGAGLRVVDVSEPVAPVQIGVLTQEGLGVGTAVQHLQLAGDRLFVSGDERVGVFDITDPARLTNLGMIPVAAEMLLLGSELLYVVEVSRWDDAAGEWVGGDVVILDIHSLENPNQVGSFSLGSERGHHIRAIALMGTQAYVVADEAFSVVDVSDPTNPTALSRVGFSAVGMCDFGDLGHSIALTGEYAYVAAGDLGLLAIDVEDPSNPEIVGLLPVTAAGGERFCMGALPYGWFSQVFIHGHFAYLLDGYGGRLVVADISDPQRPRVVGRNRALSQEHNIGQMSLNDELVYLALSYGGLVILNPYYPAPAFPVIGCAFPRAPEGVALRLEAVPGVDLQLERSTDLEHWEDWVEVRMGNGPIRISDPHPLPQGGRMFYRAVAR